MTSLILNWSFWCSSHSCNGRKSRSEGVGRKLNKVDPRSKNINPTPSGGRGSCPIRMSIYNPSLSAAFSVNTEAFLIYLLRVSFEVWPNWFWIDRSGAPLIAANVTNPALSEWPENRYSPTPTRLSDSFRMSLTDWSVRRVGDRYPHWSIRQKRSPDEIPEI